MGPDSKRASSSANSTEAGSKGPYVGSKRSMARAKVPAIQLD